MKQVLLTVCAAVVCLTAALSLAPTGRHCLAEEPAGGKPDIDDLITRLGSESFEAREVATRRLMEREDAIPALRGAIKSRDPEVARRAREILESLARREKERAFAALADAAKRGAVDQAVERLVRREKWDDEVACWRVMASLGNKLTDLERETYKKASPWTTSGRMGEQLFPTYVKLFRLKTTGAGSAPALWERRLVLRAEEILEGGNIEVSLFAVSGSIKVRGLQNCAIFAGGSVDVGGMTLNSLIVCDGDFTARQLTSSLVIARGTIRCEDYASGSRLISCGKVEFKHPERIHGSTVVEKEAKPLGLVTFFDPAEVGIKVESAEGGVRVKEAAKEKPFAAAGLVAGDVVTALDGDAVKDAEGFRRLLRAKLALEGTTTFKVRRDQKTLEIPVPHKD
jgi:hypothetical protein